jgi:uncharacterized membrane protein
MTDVQTMGREALKTMSKANPAEPDSPLSGGKGVAAGLALAALPFIGQGVAKLARSKASDLGEKAISGLGEKAKQTAKEAAGELPTEKLAPDLGQGMIGKLFGGDGGGGGEGDDADGDGRAAPGHGSGRRMPIQQAVDVAVPLEVAYNEWTQFEDWPEFMHRVESVEQVDDATVALTTKTWGITKRFEAKILDQRPDERVEWDVQQGLSHTGVATFHRISDKLTRIEVTVDVEPDSLLEKAGRGMRFMKRAVRGDLHRFKAYVELNQEDLEGGWRGTIEDGEVKRRTERKRNRSNAGRSRSRSRSGSSGRSGSSRRSGARRRSGTSGSSGSSGRSRASSRSGSQSGSRGGRRRATSS